MDSIDAGALRARAQRGYELSRLRNGMYTSLWALPAVIFSLVTANAINACILLGAGLLLAVTALSWLGQGFGRAIVPSLLIGSAPLALPLLLRGGGHACLGGTCWSVCMLGCIAGGLAAGAAIGWLSSREREQRWSFLGSAMLLTALTGSLGCAVVGAAGTMGMLIAVVVSSLPVSLVTHTRAGV
jgi:hypothetical protein